MNKKLVWNVLNYDFNSKKVVSYNVCCILAGEKKLQQLLKEHNDKANFKKELISLCAYYFRSRREYEISVGDAFETDPAKLEKWDIYSQIMLNFKLFSDYIWDSYGKEEYV